MYDTLLSLPSHHLYHKMTNCLKLKLVHTHLVIIRLTADPGLLAVSPRLQVT